MCKNVEQKRYKTFYPKNLIFFCESTQQAVSKGCCLLESAYCWFPPLPIPGIPATPSTIPDKSEILRPCSQNRDLPWFLTNGSDFGSRAEYIYIRESLVLNAPDVIFGIKCLEIKSRIRFTCKCFYFIFIELSFFPIIVRNENNTYALCLKYNKFRKQFKAYVGISYLN